MCATNCVQCSCACSVQRGPVAGLGGMGPCQRGEAATASTIFHSQLLCLLCLLPAADFIACLASRVALPQAPAAASLWTASSPWPRGPQT